MTIIKSSLTKVFLPAIAASCLIACTENTQKGDPIQYTPLSVELDPAEAAQTAKTIRDEATVTIADGLKLDLWASDSLAPDPVAISIDDMGRIYMTRTNRQKRSEFDIRRHTDWMTKSISLQNVEDRRKFLRETFPSEKSQENEWLRDLNEDGIHDWNDLAIEKEEIWRIEDTSGDGVADKAVRILSDFYQEVTDVAGALLVRAKDLFIGVAPDMWRLFDTDNDGIPDKKTSISHGYAVHIGFSGHGMSNAVEGPDGKIYWGIGDIGANITTAEGVNHDYANEGVIVRSNPDGSDFEVVAHGLRNTHEFVFDEYGNIISSDNDGDHPGERERLVHIVEGTDAGWRSNWQYGKYTDPRNNTYKVWMDEKLHVPHWEGQAAYILPPIMNYHNGPAGMVYNPGTALGSAWKNKFFLVEFVGNPARSPIWAFDLKPKGASFDLKSEQNILQGILPTGIRFGPDGALYVADWINGWATKNYGRIWKLDVTDETNDLKDLRAETKRLIQMDYEQQTENTLYDLLFNPDMRIRQKAQFELVSRTKKGLPLLQKAVSQKENQLARVHGIWGIGQLSATNKSDAQFLLPFLKDSDEEIVAQVAKILGDSRIAEAGSELIPLLKSTHPRIKFFAAQSLGRIKAKTAVTPILDLIKDNNDQDLYLRHAGVLALSRIGEAEPLIALANSPEKSLRVAAVLVLRKLKDERISIFLKDQDEYIVTEAARAINDDHSIPASLPALAATLSETRFTSEPLLRRAINAALRVGGDKELDLVKDFASRLSVNDALRAEAVAALATWATPSVLDRVDGRFRGEIKRDPAPIKAKLASLADQLTTEKSPEVQVALTKLITELNMTEYQPQLAAQLKVNTSADVRIAALKALKATGYAEMDQALQTGMDDKDQLVRAQALSMMGELSLSKATLGAITKKVFDKGSINEQQQLLKVFSQFPTDKTEDILSGLIQLYKTGKISKSIALELQETVAGLKSEKLTASLSETIPADSYIVSLYGGNERAGRQFFYTNSAGQCVRCHVVNGQGGEVGPDLTHIGSQLSREQLLDALVEPSKRIAPGFGMVSLTLKNGDVVSGILTAESKNELTVKNSDNDLIKVSAGQIERRDNVPSSMPPMGDILSKSELRDVVEFLANMKK